MFIIILKHDQRSHLLLSPIQSPQSLLIKPINKSFLISKQEKKISLLQNYIERLHPKGIMIKLFPWRNPSPSDSITSWLMKWRYIYLFSSSWGEPRGPHLDPPFSIFGLVILAAILRAEVNDPKMEGFMRSSCIDGDDDKVLFFGGEERADLAPPGLARAPISQCPCMDLAAQDARDMARSFVSAAHSILSHEWSWTTKQPMIHEDRSQKGQKLKQLAMPQIARS